MPTLFMLVPLMYACCVPSYSHPSCLHSQRFHGCHLLVQWNPSLQLCMQQMYSWSLLFWKSDQVTSRSPPLGSYNGSQHIPWQNKNASSFIGVLVSVVVSSCGQNVKQEFSSALAIFVRRGKERGRDLHASEKGTGIYLVRKVELFLMCWSSLPTFLFHIPSSCIQK